MLIYCSSTLRGQSGTRSCYSQVPGETSTSAVWTSELWHQTSLSGLTQTHRECSNLSGLLLTSFYEICSAICKTWVLVDHQTDNQPTTASRRITPTTTDGTRRRTRRSLMNSGFTCWTLTMRSWRPPLDYQVLVICTKDIWEWRWQWSPSSHMSLSEIGKRFIPQIIVSVK